MAMTATQVTFDTPAPEFRLPLLPNFKSYRELLAPHTFCAQSCFIAKLLPKMPTEMSRSLR